MTHLKLTKRDVKLVLEALDVLQSLTEPDSGDEREIELLSEKIKEQVK